MEKFLWMGRTRGATARRALAHGLRVGCCAAAVLGAALIAGCGGSDDGESAVQAHDATLALTDKGSVRGQASGKMLEFLGIPYAAAPIGPLRWRPPEPAPRWEGERDATRVAAHCPQPDTPFGTASASEDCLFLSVRRPAGDGPFPVMVWIHGGALWLGQGDEYDPRALVEQGVVVVTLNYRLGILGFLTHPALSAESPDAVSGNYGLLDQQAALRWVRDNIAQFGGDARNVTLFGQSAGGLSVSSQLVSPAAAGLFHKAIIQSGSYSMTQPSLPAAETSGAAFGAAANCPAPGADSSAGQAAACLRALSVAQVLTAQGFPPIGFVPTVDGKVLPHAVSQAFGTGQFHRVPVLAGSTGNEFSLLSAFLFDLVPASAGGLGPVTQANFAVALASSLQVFGVARTADQVTAEYAGLPFASRADAIDAIGTDAAFACRGRDAQRLLSQHTSVYTYEFNDPNAPMFLLPPVRAGWGAYHAAELPYLFAVPTRTGAVHAPFSADQQRLSAEMVAVWTQFARTGTPNPAGTTAWPAFSAATEGVWSLEPAASRVTHDFASRHHCGFWSGS